MAINRKPSNGRRRAAAVAMLLAVAWSQALALGRHDARNGDECRAQVTTNYDALEAEMRAHGNLRGIAVMNRRGREPALADCEQLDRSLRDERLMASYQRLSTALERLRSGRAPSAADAQVLAADHDAIEKMPPAPYREAYLRLHADYLRYLSVVPAGSAPTPPTALPGESCESLRAQVQEGRRAHELAVNLLVSGEDKDWRALEARRQAALSDLRWYEDRSRMLGCTAPAGASAMADQAQPVSPGEQVPDLQAAGHLQPSGGYLAPPRGSTVSLLPDGGVFVYGNGMATSEWRSQQEQGDALRHRSGTSSAPDAGPKFYDAQRRGWRRLPPAPECRVGDRYLHTATVLPDGPVLIAGGLCDEPKMADDPTLHAPHFALSLWDPASRQWKPAPALAQARIFHSASLMPDGSVLLAGGESDPALSPGSEAVLASVERYAKGGLSAAPAMGTARAKHTATAMPDGRLLVAGGFDAEGRPIASAEVLDARGTAWTALPPMHVARHSHSATLLADGRVLVAGGVGVDGRPVRAVELWDPITGGWMQGPELPLGLYGHAAVRLSTGDVLLAGGGWVTAHGGPVPWAWTWSPQSAAWQLAGLASPADEREMSSPVSVAAQPDGSALVFTPAGVLRWRPGPVPDAAAPAWQSTPAIAKLPQRRLMLVGHLAGDFGNGAAVARIWDAATDRWSDAGTLEPGSLLEPKALALPSGRVIHVGVQGQHALRCSAWQPGGTSWSSCGGAQFEYLTDWGLQLGLLPDGRAFALTNGHEAAVFDEAGSQWAVWRVDWQTHGLTYGTPVRGQQPLATLTDPASGRSFEVNDAGARFLRATNSAPAPAMLWNAQAGWWDYVLSERGMGADAQRLPDGCAISTGPIALYRPTDASIVPLPDPGFGTQRHAMVVMDDGTVVVAGVAAGTQEPGSGFFHRKASCAGFEGLPGGDGYISPTVAVDPRPAPAPRAVPPSPPWWRRGWDAVVDHQRLIIVLGLTVAAYLLLRRVRWPRLRGSRSLMVRLVVYGGLGIFLMPWVLPLVEFVRAIPAEGWRQIGRGVQEVAHAATTPTRRPCKLIGTWSSIHRGVMRRIELKDDGRYVMAPSMLGVDPPGGYTGQWTVQDDKIVWRDDKTGAVDANPMLDVSDGRFEVTEGDGDRTRFERIEAKPSAQCDKT